MTETVEQDETQLSDDERELDAQADEQADEEEREHAERAAEPEPETDAPKSEKEIERALKTLERENTRHKNRVSEIIGADAQGLVPCPRCLGFADGLVFPPEVVPVEDAQREAVLASIGEGVTAGPPLQPAKGVETCPTCLGNGQLEFPTYVEHTRVQMCVKCQGAGYVTAEPSVSNVSPITMPAASSDWTPPVVIPACSRCGMAGMEGQPHYCAPAGQATG